ncbi:unknown [Methanoculleus sp. CAG:1088]|nr:unknown [Methanoculleus sp. CAG:1088]
MEQYSDDEENGKKKLLVPLIVLLLCAVSVIGAGYAYESTLHVNDNPVDGAKITITYDGGSTLPTADADSLVIYNEETWEMSEEQGYTKSYSLFVGSVDSSGEESSKAMLATVPVKIDLSNASEYKVTTVSISLKMTGESTHIDLVDKLIHSLDIVSDGETKSMVYNGNANAYEVSFVLDEASENEVQKTYELTYDLIANLTDGPIDVSDNVTADDLLNAISSVEFDLSFSANGAKA